MSVDAMSQRPLVTYREIAVPSKQVDFGIGIELSLNSRLEEGTGIGEGSPASTFGSALFQSRGSRRIHVQPMGGGDAGRTASGWIMILYSLQTKKEWGSSWHCVAFADFPLNHLEDDPLTPSLYWEIMSNLIKPRTCGDLRGTVSLVHDQLFGSDIEQKRASCQIRVSWTPVDSSEHCPQNQGCIDAGGQVDLWARLLCSVRGNENFGGN